MTATERGAAIAAMARKYEVLLRLACIWGALVIAAVLLRGVFDQGGSSADFRLFYETVERARSGLPMYGPLVSAERTWMPGPNYNPPHFYLFVAPFALFPFSAAFVSWTLAGLAAGLFLARRTAQALNVTLRPEGVLLVGGLVLANASLAGTLRVGQLSFFLAVPVTLAWIEGRHGRWIKAGAWLGLAASLKPFLLVFGPYLVLRGKWRGALAMAAAGAAALAVGAAAFGTDAFHDWIAAFGSPRMDPHFFNSSFGGFVGRTTGEEWIPAGQAAAAVALGATILTAVRSTDLDHAWLLLLSGSLLWSPLGWIYYGWLLMPPALALGVKARLPPLIWAWVLLWLWPPYTPRLSSGPPIVASTLGSIYFWGLLLMWIGLMTMRPSAASALPAPDGQPARAS